MFTIVKMSFLRKKNSAFEIISKELHFKEQQMSFERTPFGKTEHAMSLRLLNLQTICFCFRNFFRLDAINTKGSAGCRKQHSLEEDHLHLPSIKMPTKLRLLFDWGNQIKVGNVFFLPYTFVFRLHHSSS
jgi:hypothetical protein